MKTFLSAVNKSYALLLRLYPRHFREEFGSEMKSDFSDMAAEANRMGILALIVFCLRELIDFSLSLLKLHFEEGRIFEILRSQPVNIGLRSSIGFGVAFGMANIIGMFTVLKLAISDDSLISRLQAIYSDLFPLEVISWMPSALGSLITGLVMGLIFAVLFTDRSKYPRYILVCTFGWFLHNTVRGFLTWCFNLSVFLDGNQIIYFTDMTLVLSGAVLGLIFIVARSERNEPLWLLVACSFAYPFVAYLYVKQLFNFFIFNTPWRFITLTILMIAFIGTVFAIVIKSDSNRKMLWVVMAGAAGQPILTHLVFFIGQLIFPPMPSWGILHDEFIFWPLELTISASNTIYGILFGLLVGSVLGFQRKSNSSTLTV